MISLYLVDYVLLINIGNETYSLFSHMKIKTFHQPFQKTEI